MRPPLITFLSDFGQEDWFVGVVHGVLHSVCPECRVVDLTHRVPPGDVARAAFVLAAAAPDFPPGTVHLAVVDPGVGTERLALAVRSRGQYFVGPDNGILEWALDDPDAEPRQLVEERYFRMPVSHTFHARDVFAPVAAHLAGGEPFERLGPTLTRPVRLPPSRPERRNGELTGRVLVVDRFGNAVTNLTVQDLSDAFPMVPESRLSVEVVGRVIRGLSRSYGHAPMGALLALIGSSGRLEVAQSGGNAAERLGIGEGDRVSVRLGEPKK